MAAASAWPLFDLFLDLPHPTASPTCPPPFSIDPPDDRSAVVKKELGDKAGVARIARFAFPEHDDGAPPPPAPPTQGGAGLNRHDVYWIQHKGFSGHTFSLQLSDGTRVHGHVRRYLPVHLDSKSRWDVGRRGIRALVLITRANGGEQLFGSILKSVEAISAQQAATPPDTHPSPQPQVAFLRALHKNHVAVCAAYLQKPDDKRAPMVLTLQGAEFGNAMKFLDVDTSRFLLPTSLMKPGESIVSACTVSAILPLLRCLGVPNSLRLLSALLSERRILLISASPTRLANCARSALSMLAQGSLHWQHLFIPVLPPHLMQYLAAPMPYLIGVLSAKQLDSVQEIGEVLIIYLDSNQMETRGIPASQVFNKIPDLCSKTMLMEDPTAASYPQLSASEELAKDLSEILKADKRAISGESALQEGTKEAVKKVGRAFGKLKEKGRQYLAKQSGEYPESRTPPPEPEVDNNNQVNHQEADYVYTESCQNEAAEEEARISFTSFFLALIGDMRWYLSQPQPGQAPGLDRNKFLQSRRALGDVEGTPMYPLLANFCQTQMLEQFAKERVEEVSSRTPVTRDAPLFVRCASHHRSSRIDFSSQNVRRVCREVAQTHPSRFLVQSNATARRLAMSLTSNTAYQGDYQEALTRLTESCREASAVLFDVMAVVWMRIRDSKGMQWKHGLYALHIIRNLILHGPLAAVAEATDGLDKIRALKKHSDGLRGKQAQQVRDAATQVYALLVDRAMLFSARRVCANTRRVLKHPPQGSLKRDSRLRVTIPFQNIHAAMAPSGHRPSAAPQPPAAPQRQAPRAAPGRPQQQPRPAPAAAASPVVDLLGIASPAEPGRTVAQVQAQSNDVLGLFDSMAVSGSASYDSTGRPPQQQQQQQQPAFAQAPTTNGTAPAPAFAQPTIAQMPPKTSPTAAQAARPASTPAPQPTIAQVPKAAAPPQYTQQQQPRAPQQAFAQQPPGVPAPHPTIAQIPPKQQQLQQPQVAAQHQQPPSRVPHQQPPGAYHPQQQGPSPPRAAATQQQPHPGYAAQGVRPPTQQQQPPYNPQQPGYAARPAAPQQYPAQPPQQQQQAYPPGVAAQPGLLPGQQPPATTNLFAAPPPAALAPAPAAPARNVNQFDPMRRDPFA